MVETKKKKNGYTSNTIYNLKKITNNKTIRYLHCYGHRNITQLLLAKKKKGNGYIT